MAEHKLTYEIKNFYGLHAKVASILVDKIQNYSCNILITKKDITVDAKKVFCLTGLGIKKGDVVTFTVVCDEITNSNIAKEILENIYYILNTTE